MIVVSEPTFQRTYAELTRRVRDARRVRTERWQGVDANNDTRELQNVALSVDLAWGGEDLRMWRDAIRPNLPWADDHFLERVGGQPLNPGEQWRNWPWANRADAFRSASRFNHTYMERLWPKYARRTEDGQLPMGLSTGRRYPLADKRPRYGIGHFYGDLEDLVLLLVKEPHTRQAWLPLFFPEDTGVGDGGRKPCTLGYQFVVRDGRMSMFYPMRSCDLTRHFRDDCYLAVRLLLWVLDRCRRLGDSSWWGGVTPGDYSMWMTSLHVFESDLPRLGEKEEELLC